MWHIIHNSSLLYFTLFYCLYHLSCTTSTWHFAIAITMRFELNSRLFCYKRDRDNHANMCYLLLLVTSPPLNIIMLSLHTERTAYAHTNIFTSFKIAICMQENVKTKKRTSIINHIISRRYETERERKREERERDRETATNSWGANLKSFPFVRPRGLGVKDIPI